MFKKFASVAMAVAVCTSMAIPAFAAQDTTAAGIEPAVFATFKAQSVDLGDGVVCDTTGNVTVISGGTYTFKITSPHVTPTFAVSNATFTQPFRVVKEYRVGDDYFFTVEAVGSTGQSVGAYVNGSTNPVATLTVGPSYLCDTTRVSVPVGGSYVVKITSGEKPFVKSGYAGYTVEYVSRSGNDYFYRITAKNAKEGDVVGFYVNSGKTPAFYADTTAAQLSANVSEVSIPSGGSTTVTVTSTASKPTLTSDDPAFTAKLVSQKGSSYTFRVSASAAKVGDKVSFFLNGSDKASFTAVAAPSLVCDTTRVNVKAGDSYQVKITASAKPFVKAGNSSYTVTFVSQSGNDYFYRITAKTAKVGDGVGFYINSASTPAFVATTV